MTETSPAAPPVPPDAREDFPYGVGRSSGPDQPVEYTRYDVASALAVLRRLEDATGEGEDAVVAPEIVTLSDEQLLGLDGHARRQPSALPWVAEHAADPAQRALVAAAGVRGLLATGTVGLADDPDDGERRWLVEPATNGCLVLRRTSRVLVSAERRVQGPLGPRLHRLAYYVHPEGLLEEEITEAGMHVFRVVAPGDVPERMVHLVDQDRVASDAGDPVTVRESELAAGGPLAERLADTRALTVLTAMDLRSDTVKQVVLHATTAEVIAQQTGEGRVDGSTPEPAEDAEVTLRAVAREDLLELAAWFVALEEG